MQISDESFVCDSCENELALELRNHDSRTVHHWCIDCCSNSNDTFVNPIEWDDLD
jgi:hypothetical protein